MFELGQIYERYPWLIPLLLVWNTPWKGLALWVAARKNDKRWFIAILLINTLALLEIVYIFLIAKVKFTFLKPGKEKK